MTVTDSSAWMVTTHAIAVAGQGLVDGVVDDLEDHVVQAASVIGISDVHSGAFSDGVETF